jgi:Rrf2 family iron-sulfur cluster assembly transcriptional regulator
MVNQTSEHAIRALLYLAQAPAGQRVAAEKIADALGAPANYLAKTLNTLRRQGLVDSSRGGSGGFRLSRTAQDITLAEVEACFAEARPRTVCLLGDAPCNASAPCAAHARWTALCAEARAPLQRTTLAELIGREETRTAGIRAGTPGQTAAAV